MSALNHNYASSGVVPYVSDSVSGWIYSSQAIQVTAVHHGKLILLDPEVIKKIFIAKIHYPNVANTNW